MARSRYAREAWGAPGAQVSAAFDLMTVPLPRPGYVGEAREDGSLPEDESGDYQEAPPARSSRPLSHMGARSALNPMP